MAYKKKCAVCGKEFEVVNSRYSLCSDECRKKKKRENSKQYNIDYREKLRDQVREYQRRNAKVIMCKICGKPVDAELGGNNRVIRKHYHEECVIKEAIQAISNGAKCDDSQIKRANNCYGYTVKELKELMEDNYE